MKNGALHLKPRIVLSMLTVRTSLSTLGRIMILFRSSLFRVWVTRSVAADE